MLEYIENIEILSDMLDHFVVSSNLYFNKDFWNEIILYVEDLKGSITNNNQLEEIDKDILISMIVSLLEDSISEMSN